MSDTVTLSCPRSPLAGFTSLARLSETSKGIECIDEP